MKFHAVVTHVALLGLMTTGVCSVSTWLSASPVQAEEMNATGLSPTEQVAFIQEHRGQFGGGDQLRRFFFGDLEPIAVQPGGAGMVVNLYNKATDTTFAYCATFDVVVAVGEGRITRFPDNEVR